MKCDSCGAPVENGKCTYCGKEFAQPQSSLKTPPAQPNGGSYYRQTPNFGQGGYVPRPPVQQAPPKKKQSFWSRSFLCLYSSRLSAFALCGDIKNLIWRQES